MLVNENDPLLHRLSTKVSESELENQCKALKPMISILLAELNRGNAWGISACQLGFDKAMFVMSVDNEDRVCINPEILAASVEMVLLKEGCLSFPGLYLMVKRPAGVAVRYHNHDGYQITERLEGMNARVFLHEFDHLIGTCFTDRVQKLKLDLAKRKRDKRQKGSKK